MDYKDSAVDSKQKYAGDHVGKSPASDKLIKEKEKFENYKLTEPIDKTHKKTKELSHNANKGKGRAFLKQAGKYSFLKKAANKEQLDDEKIGELSKDFARVKYLKYSKKTKDLGKESLKTAQRKINYKRAERVYKKGKVGKSKKIAQKQFKKNQKNKFFINKKAKKMKRNLAKSSWRAVKQAHGFIAKLKLIWISFTSFLSSLPIAPIIAIAVAITIIISAIFSFIVVDNERGNGYALNLPEYMTDEWVEWAVQNFEDMGVPAAVCLGQGVLEGTYPANPELNNPFGIMTWEGGYRHLKSFSSVKFAFQYYAENFLTSTYQEGWNLAKKYKANPSSCNSDNFIDAVADIYAPPDENPEYKPHLKRILKDCNLYILDGLLVKDLDKIRFDGWERAKTDTQINICDKILEVGDWGSSHRCELWAATVYGNAGLTYHGTCCASMTREHLRKDNYLIKKGKIPAGACVYSDPRVYQSSVHDQTPYPHECGHVGIMGNDGKVYGDQCPFGMPVEQWVSMFGFGGYSFHGNDLN